MGDDDLKFTDVMSGERLLDLKREFNELVLTNVPEDTTAGEIDRLSCELLNMFCLFVEHRKVPEIVAVGDSES